MVLVVDCTVDGLILAKGEKGSRLIGRRVVFVYHRHCILFLSPEEIIPILTTVIPSFVNLAVIREIQQKSRLITRFHPKGLNSR